MHQEEPQIATLQEKIRTLETECRDFNEARDYYLKIFEDFPALIWRAGLDMKCDYFNRTWLAFTGRTLAQEQGDGWAEGVHLDDLDACFQTYVTKFKAREPFAMFYRLKNRFGEYRWIKDIGRPFFNLDNEFMGYIGSCYDVTEERENSLKLETLNRSKDKFFSIVAHDLKGPIGAIEGLTDLLDSSFQDYDRETLGNMVHELSNAAAETGRLLKDLLGWSYSQLQGTTCRPEALSLDWLVRDAASPLRETMALKKVPLEIFCPGEVRVFADPDMMKTVFRNLLSNAVKYSRENSPVQVTGWTKDGQVLVQIRDFGVGIAAKELDELFTLGSKFSRVGTQGEKGTGLGLVICQDFVERNGGKIWAESHLDQGTTFTVRVPSAGEIDS